MRRITLAFSLCLSFICTPCYANELDSVLIELDKAIAEKEVYIKQKEQRISDLKQLLKISDITLNQKFDINTKLYNEYKSFIPDSAAVFILENLYISNKLDNHVWRDESKINLASLYSVSGMYIDTDKILNTISIDSMPDFLVRRYYDAYKQLFYFYPSNLNSQRYYKVYRDSLLAHLDRQSNEYKIVYSEKLTHLGKHSQARKILLQMFQNSDNESHWHAVLAYAIGETYRGEDNSQMQKKYYAISAISDIKSVIKENAAMRALAIVCFETNDIERAYKYVQQSMEDAVFSNARLRTMEVSQVFPIIEKSYQNKLEKQKDRLFYMLICIGLLSFFLVIAIIYVYIQLNKLAKARQSLYTVNEQLHFVNNHLQESNIKMLEINKELYETNLLKETYISQFLDICSIYINKLEKFQNTLNKKAMEHKLEELYKLLKSKDMIEGELKELYDLFDNIFLHLYPNFVEEFNNLLLEDERVIIKPTEILTPELRIFALIRLGISDSSKIASFLRYSPTTIYNYRTRVRNKSAVPREEFENYVMRIGLISK
ncbi:DUF6377 domain-containing protein [Paludibacter sp.]